MTHIHVIGDADSAGIHDEHIWPINKVRLWKNHINYCVAYDCAERPIIVNVSETQYNSIKEQLLENEIVERHNG